MANNRKCTACGTKYSYCPSCSRADALKPAYFAEFCSESCATLWSILTKYNMELTTKDEAKEIISSLDLKPIDTYAACVQRDYAKVMAEERKSRKFKKPDPVEIEPIIEPEEPIVEPEPVDVQIEQPIVAEFVAIEPTVHEVILKEDE